jgi:hypothetical protein
MVSNLPSEINLNIIRYMDFDTLLKSYLYLDDFNNFINTNMLDNMIEEKLAVYYIADIRKNILKNNKEKMFRFLKYISNKAPYIAFHIANMDDSQYSKFDYLSNNGINYIFAEKASKYSNNLNQNQIDKLIEIYQFIVKNHVYKKYSESLICYDTIIEIVQTFNKEQIDAFYYLYQNGLKERFAVEIINIINESNNNINMYNVINIYKDGCPDYLIVPVLEDFDIEKCKDFLQKIKSGMKPFDAFKLLF